MPQFSYEVLSPEAEQRPMRHARRRPVEDFHHAVIAELWDDRFYGDEIFAAVRSEFQRRFPGVRIVDHRVFGNIHGLGEESNLARLPDLLKSEGCTAVLSAVGA